MSSNTKPYSSENEELMLTIRDAIDWQDAIEKVIKKFPDTKDENIFELVSEHFMKDESKDKTCLEKK